MVIGKTLEHECLGDGEDGGSAPIESAGNAP